MNKKIKINWEKSWVFSSSLTNYRKHFLGGVIKMHMFDAQMAYY